MNACRTCFSRYDLSPLFDDSGVVKFTSDQLLLVTGVQIAQNDGYPQSACKKCIKTISRALDLRELSAKVDKILKTISKQIAVRSEGNYTEFNILQTYSDSDSHFDLNYDDFESNDYVSKPQTKKTNDAKIPQNFNTDFTFSEVPIDVKPFFVNKFTNDTSSKEDDNECSINIKVENDYVEECEKDRSDDEITNTNDVNTDVSITPEQTQTDIKLENPKNPKLYKHKQTNKHKEILSDDDVELGKVSNVKIENYIPRKHVDALFSDAQLFQVKMPDVRPLSRPRSDQSRHNSILKSKMNEKNPYNNNFKEKDQELKPVKAEKQKNGKKKKYDPEMVVTEETIREIYTGKLSKLMSLAVTPFPLKGPVQCKLCDKILRTVPNFRTHSKGHFEREFTCEFQNCGKKFLTKNHMQYHQQRRHGEKKRLACSYCPFRAVDRNTINNHERAEHTGERPYQCNECGAAFRMRNNLTQHLIIHFGVRNIQCEFCPSLFTRRSQLWDHQNKVHFLSYTYHCYLCPETYKGRLPVKRHLASVHGVPIDQQLKIQRTATKKDDAPSTSGSKTDVQQNDLYPR